MICPKCNKDIGELQICPDCGCSISATQSSNTKSKKIGIAVFAFMVGTLVLAIIATVMIHGAKKPSVKSEPAEIADWSVILSDYQENQVSANEKYKSKRMIFYVSVKDIESYGVEVNFYDTDWKDTGIRFFGNRVSFTDVSSIRRGGRYIIEGALTSADYNGGNSLDFVRIDDANVIT